MLGSTTTSPGAQLQAPKLSKKYQGLQDGPQAVSNRYSNEHTLEIHLDPKEDNTCSHAVADFLKASSHRWTSSVWKKV